MTLQREQDSQTAQSSEDECRAAAEFGTRPLSTTPAPRL